MSTCPFCEYISSGAVTRLNSNWCYVADKYPVSDGHVLLLPIKHILDFSDVPDGLAECLLELTAGIPFFNIGLNNGVAAGQTVEHIHFHVIPRSLGDVPDPRGGVRGVIPHKRSY